MRTRERRTEMEFTLRTVEEGDAGSIVELLNPIIRAGTYTIMDAPLTIEDQLDYIRAFPDRGVFHAAVGPDGSRVLGTQGVEPLASGVAALHHVGEIGTFVSLESQRRGIGRALCKATFAAAREKGFRKLRATIRVDNPLAIAFYKAQGFVEIGVARNHALIGGVFIDEVLTERMIP